MTGKIYLIPTPICEDTPHSVVLPQYNEEVIRSLDYFAVENIRTARRFISKCNLHIQIDALEFVELSEHSTAQQIETMLAPVLEGRNCGIMSEAGVPGVADPGAELVALAHRHGIEVIPLIGPSSIILALMASGLNGQCFTFNGYLPVKDDARRKKIGEMCRNISSKKETQLFIETPYRNDKLFAALLQQVPAEVRLCVACGITATDQFIKTLTIQAWKKEKNPPSLHKVPTIFLLG